MKKLFYAVLFVSSLALTFTACTEEEVTPTSTLSDGDTSGGGSGGQDPLNPKP